MNKINILYKGETKELINDGNTSLKECIDQVLKDVKETISTEEISWSVKTIKGRITFIIEDK